MHLPGHVALIMRPALLAALILAAGAARADEPDANEPAARSPEGAERVTIGDFIRAHIGPLQECYEQRLAEEPDLKGKLMLRFDIAGDGAVTKAAADGIPNRKLIDCVVARILKWKFPTPAGGARLRVAYPISFQPGT